MKKYIDAEKLKSLLRKKYNTYKIGQHSPFRNGKVETLRETIELIDSLQQEQPVLPGIEEPGIPGKDYIPVDWVDACEMYGKWKIVKQEQPEVDVKKELHAYICSDEYMNTREDGSLLIARHFYELGLKARKV